MDINIMVAIFAGIFYWLGRLLLGYTVTGIIFQPICIGLYFGLIMGDVTTAMLIAVSIQLVYAGLISPGANIPADEILASCVAIPVALATGVSPEAAVMIAVPVGIAGVFVDQFRKTLHSVIVRWADAYAARGDEKGLARCALLYPMAMDFVLLFPIAFVAVFFGAEVIGDFFNILPEWVMHGLSICGGLMPAVGFAMILKLVGKPSIIPMFFIGFFVVKYFGLSTIGVAVIGIAIAVMITLMKSEQEAEVLKKVKASAADDDDDGE